MILIELAERPVGVDWVVIAVELSEVGIVGARIGWIRVGAERIVVVVSLVGIFLSNVTIISDIAIFSSWNSLKHFI